MKKVMYKGKKVSVVFGTYKEKKTVRKAINDLFATGFVDEVVVVNNNAEKGTDEEVKKTKAKLYYEPRQGYAWAFQKAMTMATGDYIITTEPDDTFRATDIEKLLVYAREFKVVQGTRTSLIGVLKGVSGMNTLRRYANVFEAKTIELLFNTTALTDVGCTFRLIERKIYNRLRKLWKDKTPLFNTEILLLAVMNRIPLVEVPVAYRKRVGESTIVGSFWKEAKWAIKIQLFIFKCWVLWLLRKYPK